jgi:hypothetical protein
MAKVPADRPPICRLAALPLKPRNIGRISMTTFDQREKAYEAKLAHDEEVRFKAIVRRDKWLGLWAAELLGKTGADAEAYAMALVNAEVTGSGDDKLLQIIRTDFDKAGIARSDHQIRRQMDELMAKALKEVRSLATDSSRSRP